MRPGLTLLTVLLFAGCGTNPAQKPDVSKPATRRLVVLSLDGLPWDLARRKMAEGKMPRLAALIDKGAAADGSVSAFPAKTAVGHATLWTGCWADRHGVQGNATPALPHVDHNILELTSGFDAAALRAEPIWRTAARQGRRVTVVSATQADPENPEDFGYPDLTIFNGFRNLEPPALITASPFAVDGRTFDVERGEGGLVVTCGALRVVVRPGEFAAVDHPDVRGVFYLHIAKLDDAGFVLYRSSFSAIVAPSIAIAARFRAECGGFVANDGQKFVDEKDMFDGTGWKRDLYLATARLNVERVKAATLWVLREFPADLTITYLPQPDDALHALLGRIELRSDKEASAALDDVLSMCDGLVGAIVDAVGPDDAVAVVSDHGMAPVEKIFYVNRALERAGLLERNDRNQIDLKKSHAIFSPSGGDFVVVNTVDRKDGIVPMDERDGWARTAALAIRNAADKSLGPGALEDPIWPADNSADFAVGLEGDVFLSAVVDERGMSAILSPDLGKSAKEPLVRTDAPRGFHTGDPRSPRLFGVMVFAGAGFRHTLVPGVRHVDFAPTVARWLGIEPAKHVAGRVVRDFLEKP